MKTVDEVLAFIRANTKAGDWTAGEGVIRHVESADNLHYCPLCWAAKQLGHKVVHALAYTEAADKLGLPFPDAAAIAHSADGSGGGYYSGTVRRKLLDACHLTEATN